jgi:ABC-type oligopeptide transport system substrate-binding subunit
MLAEVGVRLRSEAMGWPQMVDAWSSGRLPLFLSGWRFENGDALSFFQDCLRSRDPARGLGGFNPGFADPRIDGLIEDHGLRGPERFAHYLDLTRAAMEEIPLVPLYHQQDIYAASTAVRWQPRLDAKLLAAEMSFASP